MTVVIYTSNRIVYLINFRLVQLDERQRHCQTQDECEGKTTRFLQDFGMICNMLVHATWRKLMYFIDTLPSECIDCPDAKAHSTSTMLPLLWVCLCLTPCE